jgi:hypothetical protein
LRSERQRGSAAEEESLPEVAAQRGGKLCVDAELADVGNAIAEPALDEAIEVQRAAQLAPRRGLHLRQMTQIGFEPRRAHRPRGQARDAHELDKILGPRIGEDSLEFRCRVAFVGDCEGGAKLHAACPHREELADALRRIDSACRDKRDRIVGDAERPEKCERRRDDLLEIKTGIGQVRKLGSAKVAARIARMLDDDRVRQAIL